MWKLQKLELGPQVQILSFQMWSMGYSITVTDRGNTKGLAWRGINKETDITDSFCCQQCLATSVTILEMKKRCDTRSVKSQKGSISNVVRQVTGPIPAKGKRQTYLTHVQMQKIRPLMRSEKRVSKLQMVAAYDWQGPGSFGPTEKPTISAEEPWLILDVSSKKVDF